MGIKYYEGEHNGMHHQSIYPALFRCEYRRRMAGGRIVAQNVIRSGRDDRDVRYRLQLSDPHGDIRGEIAVSFLVDLAPVYDD